MPARYPQVLALPPLSPLRLGCHHWPWRRVDSEAQVRAGSKRRQAERGCPRGLGPLSGCPRTRIRGRKAGLAAPGRTHPQLLQPSSSGARRGCGPQGGRAGAARGASSSGQRVPARLPRAVTRPRTHLSASVGSQRPLPGPLRPVHESRFSSGVSNSKASKAKSESSTSMMRARGVAAQGARPLAAATCWTRRPVSRPRPTRASLWVLGCIGG